MRKGICGESSRFAVVVTLAFISAAFSAAVPGQNIKNTDFSPDKVLKSNARVNPSTLAMEMSVPLIGYAGRAGNGTPVTLSYSSKVWGMENYGSEWLNNLDMTINDVRPLFAENTAAGWSSSLGPVRLDFSRDVYRNQGSGSSEMEGQIFTIPLWEEEPDGDVFYIKRVRVTMPDGSSHEMRASDAPINCGTVNGTGCTGVDNTGTFLSVDGSRMRLESGSSTSVLYLPDGGRYFFGAPSGNINLATAFHDVHGNKAAYNASTREWTDTVGHSIADPLPDNFGGTLDQWAGAQHQTVTTVEAKFPGFGGGTNTYDVDVEWAELEDVLLNTSDALRYIGRRECDGSNYTLLSPYLFEDGSDPNTRLCNFGPLFNPAVLKKITLPNGQFYEFKYNVFGEITKIIYPTGAYERFAYGVHEPLSSSTFPYEQANRGVTDRWVSEKGDGTDEVRWIYSVSSSGGYSVTITAPDGSYTKQYLHTEPVAPPKNPYGFGSAYAGRAYDEQSYDSSTAHNLRSRKLTVYEATGPVGTGAWSTASRDMRPTKEISIIFDPANSNALATMTETVYDTAGNSDAAYFSSLNAKQQKTHHYIVKSVTDASASTLTPAAAALWFSSATPASVTEMDYLYDSNYKARNVNGLVAATRVLDPANTSVVKAKTEITYDGVSLLDESESTRWENPSTIYRGLVTKTRSWHDIANNLYIDTQAQYDLMGNLRYSWDGRGNLTQTVYSSTFDYAYPTEVKSPIPDSTGAYGANAELVTTTDYDFNTGLTKWVKDPNGQSSGLKTEMEYNDSLLRPTKVTAPNGHQTVTEYGAGTSASTRWVKVRSQIDADRWREGRTYFDGLGRPVRTQSIDDDGDVFALSCYDTMGRVSKATNPFRNYSTQDCTTTTGLDWTTNTFDTVGRPRKVTTPDNAVVETTYSLATSGSQIGTVVTVEDQADKQRRSITNALGQLIRVDEPDNSSTTGSLGSLTAPNQPTIYTYDTLNNLTGVQQVGNTTAECGGASSCAQTRTFTYDALSRLKEATNPESATIKYTYDENSNLKTKWDARGLKTIFDYDRLNRGWKRCYKSVGTSTLGNTTCAAASGEAAEPNTPDVTMYYDNVANAKGKLTKVSSSVSTTEYTTFDILGRVTAHKQTTDSNEYTTAYTYDLSGALVEQTYPSGRKVQNTLDASGDLEMVSSRKNANSGYWAYANNFTYNAAGAVTSMQLGNGTWESTTFNNRLQPEQIALGTIQSGHDKLKLNYSYGTTTNNGNIQSQTITVPGLAYSFAQTYVYDSLNRLSAAEETYNYGQTWKQAFTFDRYGNRNFDEGDTTFNDFLKECSGAF
jgi:YD repeat-containing protein